MLTLIDHTTENRVTVKEDNNDEKSVIINEKFNLSDFYSKFTDYARDFDIRKFEFKSNSFNSHYVKEVDEISVNFADGRGAFVGFYTEDDSYIYEHEEFEFCQTDYLCYLYVDHLSYEQNVLVREYVDTLNFLTARRKNRTRGMFNTKKFRAIEACLTHFNDNLDDEEHERNEKIIKNLHDYRSLIDDVIEHKDLFVKAYDEKLFTHRQRMTILKALETKFEELYKYVKETGCSLYAPSSEVDLHDLKSETFIIAIDDWLGDAKRVEELLRHLTACYRYPHINYIEHFDKLIGMFYQNEFK